MKRRLAVSALIAGLLAIAAIPAFAAQIATTNDGYTVDFTEDNGDATVTAAEFPQAQAQAMANALSNVNAATLGTPNGYHNGYRLLGFDDPDFGGATRPVFVLDCSTVGGCDSGDAPADRIRMPAMTYRNAAEACVRLVLGHELFHHTQYEAIDFANWSTWGADPVEGTARVMQDKVYNDLDLDNGCITYLSEVNNYLGSPGLTLWGRSYTTAIFWSYLMERLGNDRTEPAVGTDFIREFWQNAQDAGSNRDFLGTLRATIAEFNTEVTLESLFHDFTIANYTKDLDVSTLSDGLLYRYLDEQQAGATAYTSVPVTHVGTIPPNVGPTALTVNRWAATYLQADIGDCTGVAGVVVDGDRAGMALVAEDGKGGVLRLDKAVTDHFARAILVRGRGEQGRLSRLGAVLSGLGDAATVDYRFACGAYTLDIREPLATKPAYVGDKSDPNRFIVRLRVQGPAELGTPSVEGLRPTDFQIQVGGDPATVLNGAYVQGEYWLTVQPPVKPGAAPDLHNLTVTLGGVSDTEANAVRYQIKHLDQVLVIDRSGSMLSPAQSPKIDAARNAASLYVDAARSDDKLGVVSFSGDNVEPNDDATLDAMLQTMSPVNRDTARTKVLGLVAGGMTSIGDGVFKGAGEFPIRGTVIGEDWLVLMSDGMQNEGKFWSDVKAAVIAAGIRVDTIALGPLTDQALLQQIASDTGGTYYYVDVSSGVASAAAPAAAGGASLANSLADVYASTLENANDLERLWDERSTVPSGTLEIFTLDLGEDKIQNAVVSVNWPDRSSPLRVRLIDPHGNLVVAGGGVEIIAVDTHTVIKMPFMDRGTWRLELESTGGGDTPFFAALAGQQIFGANLFVKVGGPTDNKRLNGYRWGQQIPIIASLTDRGGAIRRAEVMAAITHPDSTVLHLPLLDDGNHGDGQADDGVYGNTYTRTTVYATRGADDENPRPNGSYVVRVVAHGKGNVGGTFHRIEHGAFALYESGDPSPDGDGDKVADLFESYHACMKSTDPSDVAADPDGDQLPSGDEWFYGTDPCHPDTDRGGEPDLSEIKRGANPFDPRDDALPRPEEPSVIDRPIDHIGRPALRRNSLLIRYPAHPSYDKIRLWRALDPDGPFSVVAEFNSLAHGGKYRDRGLINDTTYWYKLEGIDFSGNPSTPSPVFSGTPKQEPMPPIGHVVINRGQPYTPTPHVKLALSVDDKDVIKMMVSNDGQFAGAVWEPFARTKVWTLAPGVGGFSTVFVKYQDKAGNESNVVTDESTLSPGLISVSGRVKPDVLPTDGSLAGIYMTLIDHPNQPSVVTNALGRFTFQNLPPGGTYTVQALGAGYATPVPVALSTTTVKVVPVKCDGTC